MLRRVSRSARRKAKPPRHAESQAAPPLPADHFRGRPQVQATWPPTGDIRCIFAIIFYHKAVPKI